MMVDQVRVVLPDTATPMQAPVGVRVCTVSAKSMASSAYAAHDGLIRLNKFVSQFTGAQNL